MSSTANGGAPAEEHVKSEQQQHDEAAAAAAAAAVAAAAAAAPGGEGDIHREEADGEGREAQHQEDQGQQPQEQQPQDQSQDASSTNFFDEHQNYQYFPQSSGAGGNSFSAPFQAHPHPQHPHLGVEALGHAAAASEHAGRVPVPSVSAPEGDGGNVSSYTNDGDASMELGTSFADTTGASSMDSPTGNRSSSGKARSSLAPPDGAKKETPYSRSPELRVSHKLAERKRRKEMKDLFDDLRDQLPSVERSPKTSKWEILTKAIEVIAKLKQDAEAMKSELAALRGEAPMPDDGQQGVDANMENTADSYKQYEEQQAASQQQIEAAAAAAAAANQFAQAQGQYDGQEQQEHDGQHGPPPPAPAPEDHHEHQHHEHQEHEQGHETNGAEHHQQHDDQQGTNEEVLRDWSSITNAAATAAAASAAAQ